jgi:hypothetical protein
MRTVLVVAMLAVAACKSAVDDYKTKAKATEAKLMLNKLSARAKMEFNTKQAFPKGSVPLTPAKACCSNPDHKCPANPADWANPIWQALEFQIDEPFVFQYSYESDGQTATIKAVGDLDCDGKTATYEAKGTAENSNPKFVFVDPA